MDTTVGSLTSFDVASLSIAGQVFLGLFVLVSAVLLMHTLSLMIPMKGRPPIYGSLIPFMNFYLFAKSPLGFVEEGLRKHGRCFTVDMVGTKLTFLIGPEAQQVFFKANDRQASQSEVYGFMKPVFGAGVVYDAPPKIRAQQLHFAATGLKTKALRSYISKIVMETDQYFAKFGNEGVFNLKDALGELIILTASRCLMGKEVRENLFAEVAHLYHDLDQGITPLSIFMPNAPTPAHWRRNKARMEMVRLFTKVIRTRRASNTKYDDILQLFCDATYRGGQQLTEDEITGMLIALLFAGQHTSSITGTWMGMHLLKKKSAYWTRLLDEQEKVLGEGGVADFDSVAEMDFLHVCVKEALRMHPPLIFLMRQTKEEMHLDDITIPVGHKLFVSPAIGHRLPDVFKNPNEYDPDRFLPPREEDKTRANSFLGFGGGIHSCLGEQFAYLQIKTVFSHLIRHFDLEMVDATKFPQPDYAAMVVGPTADGCMVRFKRKVPIAE